MKSIDFLDESATAVYFYDMTHHVESLKLESEVIESKNRNAILMNDQMIISHEFRTPLSTCLMFLESLLNEHLSAAGQRLIKIIISQVNLLLCLVNDILDLKLIEEKKFVNKQEIFSPRDTLEFIVNMFAPQVEMQNTKISYETILSLKNDGKDQNERMPKLINPVMEAAEAFPN